MRASRQRILFIQYHPSAQEMIEVINDHNNQKHVALLMIISPPYCRFAKWLIFGSEHITTILARLLPRRAVGTVVARAAAVSWLERRRFFSFQRQRSATTKDYLSKSFRLFMRDDASTRSGPAPEMGSSSGVG